MKIVVLMSTYNGEKYIKEQVDSILSQLSDSDELIISDDLSTDKTLDILSSYNDKRIKVINHQPHKGLPPHVYATLNFENALKNAKGDYIFLSDQDDVWLEDKLAVAAKAIGDTEGPALYFCQKV